MMPNKKPDVLFITRKWPPAVGGMEKYSAEFAKAAAEISNLTTYKLDGHKSEKTPNAIQMIAFGMKTAIQLIFNRNQYDNIHGGDLAVWPLIWIAKLGRPKSNTSMAVHGTDIAFAFRTTHKARLYKAYLKIGKTCLGRTNFIANSNATADLTVHMGFKNIQVTPLCIRPEQTLSAPKENNTEPYLLFVGRLIKAKGCGWFIQEVLQHLPETLSLKVAGTIIDQNEGNALQHPKVEYLGPVYGDELKKLRQKATAIIVPNIDFGIQSFEGFGLTAVEGAIDGGVVLASNVYGLKDALIPDITGYLLDPGNASTWIKQIETVLNWESSERIKFLEKAQKALEASPGWEDVVRQSLHI